MDNSTLDERFWSKVRIGKKCWRWIGQTHDGYGRLDERFKSKHPSEQGKIIRRTHYAHRFSWTRHFGMIPKGAHVLHKCDNRWCVNPSHLFLGDQRANNKDKMDKSRQAKGNQFPHAKLTAKKVLAIRARYAAGNTTLAKLGDEYGIAHGQIGAIVRREAWKHI